MEERTQDDTNVRLMTHPGELRVQAMGQSTFRLEHKGVVIYTDPYLTDRVAELEGPELRRLTPPPLRPDEVKDADWVLITHDHLDHCDPTTLGPLAVASPQAKFVAPQCTHSILAAAGIGPERVMTAREGLVLDLGPTLRLHTVPAAHTDIQRDPNGALRFVGYVLEPGDRRIYFAGDTSPHPEIVTAVTQHGPVHVAILPINERNHYKERRGIVGNMSIREAFALTEEIGASTLVPMHYDLFAVNSVFPEEVELLAKKLQPPFEVLFNPEVL